MAPKPPPKPAAPPPPKNIFERFGDYLDSDRGKKRTKILVSLFFVLAVVMTALYKTELDKGRELILAVASIRQFALEYDPSLQGKSDLEVLGAVHLLTLKLLNWTLKNEELQKELNILTDMLPGWQAFDKNLYFFSNTRKTWQAARDDCLARHTADLVSCRFGEEQGFIDKMSKTTQRGYWMGLRKNSSVTNGLLWVAGYHAGTLYWAKGQPSDKDSEDCIAAIPPCDVKHCWHDDPCADLKFFCCKMMPNSVWFY